MADEADRADQEAEFLIAEQIRAVGRRHAGIVPRGTCHYCDEAAERLFCGVECSEDFEIEQAQLKRMGRR